MTHPNRRIARNAGGIGMRAAITLAGAIALAIAVLGSAGCQQQAEPDRGGPAADTAAGKAAEVQQAPPTSESDGSSALAAALKQAGAHQQPIMVVVIENGRGPVDADVEARFGEEQIRSHLGSTLLVVLDQGSSRVRAEVSRFHLAEVPLLITLSSRGIIEYRDEAPFDDALILKRLMYAEHIGAALDARLTELEERVADLPDDIPARMKLARFLISRHNASEAIPHFALVRAAGAGDQNLRIQAAVEEARAHFWIGEPEKGRHVAEELIATLGAQSPEARCAGYYALGAQDVLDRHRERGLHELEQALAAAPDSDYGIKAKAAREEATAAGK